jgi:hypothetical protein
MIVVVIVVVESIIMIGLLVEEITHCLSTGCMSREGVNIWLKRKHRRDNNLLLFLLCSYCVHHHCFDSSSIL